MKNKALVALVTIPAMIFLLSACSLDKEHLSFFETEEFTEQSFIEAVRKYGDSYQSSSGETFYSLSSAQVEASYKNPTVKPLLTSAYYDKCSENNLHIGSLWSYLGDDMFAEDVVYTIDLLVNTIKEFFVWSAEISSRYVYYIISNCEDALSSNPSVIDICENNGPDLFHALYTEEYEVYESDLIDLFKKTDTWTTNCSIAYTSFITHDTYPLAFEASFWYNNGWKYNGKDYGFSETADIYPRIVSCIKSRLRDPDSYQANGNIDFYRMNEPLIINGMYSSRIYVKVPIRAKNGFGGYGNAVYWLIYDWKNQSFSWYGENTPDGIYTYPFETCRVSN